MIRFTLWTMGLAVVGVVGAAGAGAVAKHPAQEIAPRPVSKAVAAKTSSVISDTTLATAQVLQQGTVVSSAASKPDTTRRPATVAVVDSVARPAPSAPATPSTPSIVPKLRQGRTAFADSVYAVRSGDTVALHFDTSPTRTRRADKFEHVVRQTLRSVYGPVADTLLAVVPNGRLAADDELVTSLPTKGIRIFGPSGRRLVLWPETRAGRDGPLVVGYHVTIER